MAGPDYHRLKTMVKRSIEQNLRNEEFWSQKWKFWNKRRGQESGDKTAWTKNFRILLGSGKPMCSVLKETICSCRHDMNKRAKSTQPNPSPRYLPRSRVWNMHREPEVKLKWETGSMALQGLPQRNLHHSILWKVASSWVLVLQVRKWMQNWEKCSYAHRQVDEQPGTRSKKNGDKSAVTILKITRQLGCVSQNMEPPKSTTILRKSSNILKPIRCVRFTKAVLRHANIRDQILLLGMICPGDPQQRSPNAPKFEDRSQEETEWQERWAREAAWRLATSILKLKEKNKAAFYSPSENRCLPAPSNLKPEEREFVVDSGASMHMIS